MTGQPILYFTSILVTILVTGWLAFYAWRQRNIRRFPSYSFLDIEIKRSGNRTARFAQKLKADLGSVINPLERHA